MTAPHLRLVAGRRDLMEVARDSREISLGLEFLARGMEKAWQLGSDELASWRTALRTMQRIERDLSALVDEVREIVP